MAELKEKFDKIKMERINKYQGVNLYVKNLDEQLADDAFRKAFEEYGAITSCKIMRDDKGQGKGFGFVCYTTPEEATKAVTEMNGKILAQKPIYVALAQRKEQRRAQLEAQIAQRVQQTRMQNGVQGMPGMYPPQGPAVFYPMQGGAQGRGQMYYQQPMPGQNMGPRRFPQQGGKGGQQFQQGAPQGYMVNGPQGNRQPRQNQRRQGLVALSRVARPAAVAVARVVLSQAVVVLSTSRALATCLQHLLLLHLRLLLRSLLLQHLLQALSTSLPSSLLCQPSSRR